MDEYTKILEGLVDQAATLVRVVQVTTHERPFGPYGDLEKRADDWMDCAIRVLRFINKPRGLKMTWEEFKRQ